MKDAQLFGTLADKAIYVKTCLRASGVLIRLRRARSLRAHLYASGGFVRLGELCQNP